MSTDPTGIKIAFDPTVQRMSGITAHGLIPFDAPFISEIAPGLWQGGCRNGLILPRFFRHLVSLYPWESYKVKHELQTSLTVRMLDSESQDMASVDEIARWVAARRKTGPVAVHCQAGLNRSSLVVARVLMLDGATADEAISMLREKRSPACLCNPAFAEWLLTSGGSRPDSRADGCTRVYRPTGRMAHLLGLGGSPSAGYPAALCGMRNPLGRSWFGTGSQDEYDRAAALPLCARCEAAVGAAAREGNARMERAAS